ncbi:hypothetical protein J4E90_002677 [Alternaria incomplexa]|uniref:uncharacterized protein n=1 Tax=Alternaria incomplexa TaxID=1187928 RepID=UPI00221FB05C|nr:uncharacterized protein J4E90_002677 [Alternaria incomplexa]KAI4918293.1 hypothetical protein J4E90_002677 [Alternaria incomplexa]
MTELATLSSAIEKLNNYATAGNILWVISLCVSKIAIVAMLLRTTQTRFHRRFQYGVSAIIVAQCLTSVLLLNVDCSVHRVLAWDITSAHSECAQSERRWIALTALDVMTEVLLLFLPIQLVWGLRMAFRTKLIVISSFWLRLPTLIFSALRQNEIHQLTTTSDVSLTAATVVIWQAVELSYSLAAATLAALKRFTESLNTGFGHGELMRVHAPSQGYKLSGRGVAPGKAKTSRKQASRPDEPEISMDTMSSDTTALPLSRFDPRVAQMKLRPEALQNTAIVSSAPQNLVLHDERVDDASLKNNIIRQEVQYSVHYEQDTTIDQDDK